MITGNTKVNELLHSDEEELMHYGVLGMKWGIRRDARVLANRRRNNKVRSIKDDYELGKITKETKKKLIKDANASKKQYNKTTKESLKNKTKEELTVTKRKLAEQSINEIPHRRLKKGLTTANKLLGTANTAVTAATIPGAVIATAANPAFGAMYIGSAAISTLGTAGAHYIAQIGIDKLT